jgi:hypothetical protein
MKVTVELSDAEMSEILELTGERKKGPAIRRLMEEALQQHRRPDRSAISKRRMGRRAGELRVRPGARAPA